MELPVLDLTVIIVYLLGIVIFGSWFIRVNKTGNDFMIAGGAIPGWAVGLSFFGTYLSSNTFIGVVGRAFGTDWNFFVFSLAIPFAVLIGVRYFIPFYRHKGEISAYHHMERRFGPWARTYSVCAYLLSQLARIATISFGMALALHGLTGWSMSSIIIVSGTLITVYTMLGGMKAVIWTDVIQSIILISGSFILLLVIFLDSPVGPIETISIAKEYNKFSLGSFKLSFSESTFWVIFLYGFFMNIKAFGFDQNNVQRYHASKSDKEARKSLYFGALLYVPISMLFFFIGSVLFSYYQTQPELLDDLVHSSSVAIVNRGETTSLDSETYRLRIEETKESLSVSEIADHALPHFMANRLPVGIAGLIIAAIMAAGMSTISTCLNSSATIILGDIYKKFRPKPGDRETIIFLRGTTLFWGILGTFLALLMIGVESILAVWWQLTGIVAGGMLGLFLLGFLSRKANNMAAIISVIIGILVILWITFSSEISFLPDFLHSPFHTYMSVVIATLSMFLVGIIISRYWP